MKKLSVRDREFFGRVEKSAFTNPLSDERIESDRQTVGAGPRESFKSVLDKLLRDLTRKLDTLSPVDIRLYSAVDSQLLRTAILFHLYHQGLSDFDVLIEEQIELGDESCTAPVAANIYGKLLQHGFSCEESSRYVAIFYQVRRAYYFISRKLAGECPCMKQLRMRLWENIFTKDFRLYVRYLWEYMEDFSTLLLGETGTGKGSAAYAIGCSGFIPFNPSTRRFSESFTRAFIQINLSQYPPALIESELFGHRKGAFTGAVEKHDGIFSRCSPHGSIFLDEIGEVSEPVQIKLLQVLQQRTYSPVGSHEQLKFKGRVIAATNKSIGSLRRAGTFRDDFYYRLCSDVITIPTLRQRIQEMPSELDVLVEHILQAMYGDARSQLQGPIMAMLKKDFGRGYSWMGNVRELEQAIRRILLTGSYEGDDLSTPDKNEDFIAAVAAGSLSARDLMSGYCKRLYAHYGNYGEVARRTGLDWRTVKSNVTNNR